MDIKSKLSTSAIYDKSGFVSLYEYRVIERAKRKNQKNKIKKWLGEFISRQNDYHLPQLWRTGL